MSAKNTESKGILTRKEYEVIKEKNIQEENDFFESLKVFDDYERISKTIMRMIPMKYDEYCEAHGYKSEEPINESESD